MPPAIYVRRRIGTSFLRQLQKLFEHSQAADHCCLQRPESIERCSMIPGNGACSGNKTGFRLSNSGVPNPGTDVHYTLRMKWLSRPRPIYSSIHAAVLRCQENEMAMVTFWDTQTATAERGRSNATKLGSTSILYLCHWPNDWPATKTGSDATNDSGESMKSREQWKELLKSGFVLLADCSNARPVTGISCGLQRNSFVLLHEEPIQSTINIRWGKWHTNHNSQG